MNPGDEIAFRLRGATLEGVVVTADDERVVVKLDNGYNVGLERAQLEQVEIRGRRTSAPAPIKAPKVTPGLPKVRILHTGGTIACRVDYATGAVIASLTPDELLALFPEVAEVAAISAEQVANIQSEYIRFSHYNAIAEAVARAANDGVDAVVITHGTDTMHYSAAALAFALEGLSLPVVLVGSQRSADRGSSDNYLNLLAALRFAPNAPAAVYIAMHAGMSDDLIAMHLGVRARKMHTSRRDAFRSINSPPAALVDAHNGETSWHAKPQAASGELRVRAFDERIKVGLLQTHPHLRADEVEAYRSYDGLIISASGLGHVPIEGDGEHERIAKVIGEMAKQMPVGIASQCLYGRVNLDVYSPGRRLRALGVVGHLTDMTPETAWVKLCWLLSNERARARELYETNLRGEISERSAEDGFAE